MRAAAASPGSGCGGAPRTWQAYGRRRPLGRRRPALTEAIALLRAAYFFEERKDVPEELVDEDAPDRWVGPGRVVVCVFAFDVDQRQVGLRDARLFGQDFGRHERVRFQRFVQFGVDREDLQR